MFYPFPLNSHTHAFILGPDIAVDGENNPTNAPTCVRGTEISAIGWALTLLSEENLSFASTAQTIGLNTGYFLSFTVFLALNSPEFA